MARGDSADQELIGYVSHCLKQGVPPNRIISTLKLRGLSEESAYLLLERPEFQHHDIPELPDSSISIGAEEALPAAVSASHQATINRRQVLNLDQKLDIETEPLEVKPRPAILAHRHDFLDYERRKRKGSSKKKSKRKKERPASFQASFLKYLFLSLAFSLSAAVAFNHFMH